MDFFDKLTKRAKETYENASKKTGELAKEAKLKMKMNENKAEINELYQEIGKKVYEKHTLSESIDIKMDLEEECTKIDILSAEIETCLNQIRELKDKKQCPKCFNEINLEAKFCNNCGAKQEEEVDARDVEIMQPENNSNEPEGTSDNVDFNHIQPESVPGEQVINEEEPKINNEESNN